MTPRTLLAHEVLRHAEAVRRMTPAERTQQVETHIQLLLDDPCNTYIDPTLQKVASDLVCNMRLGEHHVNCTPQISYPYTPNITRVVTDDLICFDDANVNDTVLRSLVADFYRRHRRACITISRFMGRPVAHDLFLSSLPF